MSEFGECILYADSSFMSEFGECIMYADSSLMSEVGECILYVYSSFISEFAAPQVLAQHVLGTEVLLCHTFGTFVSFRAVKHTHFEICPAF